jgi:hypothetical protein
MTDLSTSNSTEVGGYKIDVPFEHQYDSKNAAEVSYYMYRKLFPLAEPVLSLNGTAYSEFEIVPSQVFNLSKSYLDFDMFEGKHAAGSYAHNGFIAPIDTIELTTAGGRQLVYLQNVPYMTKVIMRPTTPYDDFLSNPIPTIGGAVPPVTVELCRERRCNLFHRNDSASDVARQTLGSDITSGLTGAPTNTEEQFTGISNWILSDDNKDMGIRYSIPLHQFAGSLLSVNKDLYFGQTIRLRITWNQGKNWGFFAAVPAVADAANAYTVCPLITNNRIRLAIQANPLSENAIKQRVLTEGIHLNVPYTHTFKYPFTIAAGEVSPTRKINKSHGQRLLRIFTASFNPNSENGGAIYCQNYNVNSLLFTRVRSQLDGKNLQDSDLINANGDLYLALQDRIDKSVGGSLTQFYNSCYMLDDWTPWKTKDSKQGDTMVAGLSLAEERQYDITFQSAVANPLIYQFVVCQKLLSITRDGVVFE